MDYIYDRAVIVLKSTARVHPVSAETAPVAADLWTKPSARAISPSHPAFRQHVDFIHHCHLLLLFSPKADTHFTAPRTVEGWLRQLGLRLDELGWMDQK